MIVQNHKYRQYAIGSVSNRQKPVSEELEIPDGASEWYSSYVFYDSDVIPYWDENGRIGGFKGDVCSVISNFGKTSAMPRNTIWEHLKKNHSGKSPGKMNEEMNIKNNGIKNF